MPHLRPSVLRARALTLLMTAALTVPLAVVPAPPAHATDMPARGCDNAWSEQSTSAVSIEADRSRVVFPDRSPVTLSGVVSGGGETVPSGEVVVERIEPRHGWIQEQYPVPLAADGSWSLTTADRGLFRACYGGDETHGPSRWLGEAVSVAVARRVTAARAKSPDPRRARITGTFEPKPNPGTRRPVVELFLLRPDGTRVGVGRDHASNGEFDLMPRLPQGRHRLEVVAPSDTYPGFVGNSTRLTVVVR